MGWTQDQILTIVQGIEKHRNLYVVKDPEYHNKNKRRSALETIVQELNIPGVTVNDIQKKWNGLRTTYAQEKRKVLASMGTGTGEDEACILSTHIYMVLFVYLYILGIQANNTVLQLQKLPNEEPLHMSQNDKEDCTSVHSESAYLIDEYGELQLITSELESKTIEENVPTPRASGSALKKNDTPKRKRACAEDMQLDMAKTATATLQAIKDLIENDSAVTEDDLFSKLIAERLKNIHNKRRKLILRNAIETALFKAELEELEDE
ncbi:hypothetical protein ILUMI_26592 [Ignelater luminosus]|uniref:MADF domain-containing protein n=1 Tax=Ignelater luminosus TaxID=2038154 RepID=A0A8K0FXB6_IGNLU|nr:hypothetical protein ILUMI_26592 [Ignelater luminosus]